MKKSTPADDHSIMEKEIVRHGIDGCHEEDCVFNIIKSESSKPMTKPQKEDKCIHQWALVNEWMGAFEVFCQKCLEVKIVRKI